MRRLQLKWIAFWVAILGVGIYSHYSRSGEQASAALVWKYGQVTKVTGKIGAQPIRYTVEGADKEYLISVIDGGSEGSFADLTNRVRVGTKIQFPTKENATATTVEVKDVYIIE